jgi:hypothetical protein
VSSDTKTKSDRPFPENDGIALVIDEDGSWEFVL